MPSIAALAAALDRLIEASRRTAREAVLQPIEKRMTRRVGQAFRTQGRAFLRRFAALYDRLPGALDDSEWAGYLEAAQIETRDLFIAAVTLGVNAAMAAGLRHGAEESGLPAARSPEQREAAVSPLLPDDSPVVTVLGIRFGLKNPRAVAYLSQVGAALVTNVDDTTRDYIRTVIVQGAREGQSYNDMAKALTARFKEFAVGKPQLHIDSRAHLIAVTEVGQAYSHGTYMVGEGLRDAGLVLEKQWDTMGDDRVSDGCAENEAAGWIPFDEAFPSGNMRPLRFPGCRCDLQMRRVDVGG